ncbi:hypothetical protein ACQPYK_24360 [Streptosporangium sp. CA-135522]
MSKRGQHAHQLLERHPLGHAALLVAQLVKDPLGRFPPDLLGLV